MSGRIDLSSVNISHHEPAVELVSLACCLCTDWILFVYVTGDVYIQPTQDTKNPVIYGVFSVSG